uniref:AlNc14C2049G13137 protein n=1 Tax=Albugo laibachii Nc14 TaxID=890382 RepID=F0X2W3_9STRA|nr:AlNc14C2049G13137 [Albugo laibachii Nc14]|eukprot:CCA28298.1 AlNc14C2049G13137 [Albugo laibachii Nc14]
MPQMNEATMPKLEIFGLNGTEPKARVSYNKQIRNFEKTKHCLKIAHAYNSATNLPCWTSLIMKYDGVVVLNRFDVIDKRQKFSILLFTDNTVDLKSKPCFKDCGKIDSSDDCMVDPIDATKLTPINSAVKWMLRTENAQLDNHVPSTSRSCFLIQYSSSKQSKCHKSFSNKMWPLSPDSFLIFLSTISEIKLQEYGRIMKFGCDNLELMPDTICYYESNRLKNNLDLNMDSNENEETAQANDVSDFGAVKVANVVVVEWDTKNSKKPKEKAAFADCFTCLTRKRKVVLISVIKRYLWMVDSGSFPVCETCDKKVTFGPQFPYNQYLRQIPLSKAIEMMETLETEEKRPRPDETELGDAFDRAPKRSK